MGNSNNSPTTSTFKNGYFQIVYQGYSNSFGEYSLLKYTSENTEQTILFKKIQDFSINYSERSMFSHPHLLTTYGLGKNFKDYVSIPNQDNSIFFEHTGVTLKQLIAERPKNQLFTEGDLVAMLKGIVSSVSFLHERGITHGDISTETVFFDEDEGIFKIHDHELICGKNSGYRLTQQRKKVAFLPPEVITVMNYYEPNSFKEKLFKVDAFAIGMVILEAATLKDSTDMYDPMSLGILMPVVNERLSFLCKFYTPEFFHIIRMMLELDPIIRITALHVADLLCKEKRDPVPKKVIETSYEVGNKSKSLSFQPINETITEIQNNEKKLMEEMKEKHFQNIPNRHNENVKYAPTPNMPIGNPYNRNPNPNYENPSNPNINPYTKPPNYENAPNVADKKETQNVYIVDNQQIIVPNDMILARDGEGKLYLYPKETNAAASGVNRNNLRQTERETMLQPNPKESVYEARMQNYNSNTRTTPPGHAMREKEKQAGLLKNSVAINANTNKNVNFENTHYFKNPKEFQRNESFNRVTGVKDSLKAIENKRNAAFLSSIQEIKAELESTKKMIDEYYAKTEKYRKNLS